MLNIELTNCFSHRPQKHINHRSPMPIVQHHQARESSEINAKSSPHTFVGQTTPRLDSSTSSFTSPPRSDESVMLRRISSRAAARTTKKTLPHTCELDTSGTDNVLVWTQGQLGLGIETESWTERKLYLKAGKDSSFRVAKVPITGKTVEIHQRDIFPPQEQAQYAHYPNQDSQLAFIKIDKAYRKEEYIFITSKKFRTWKCCRCLHMSEYDSATFGSEKCQCDGCGEVPCERCVVESVGEVGGDDGVGDNEMEAGKVQ